MAYTDVVAHVFGSKSAADDAVDMLNEHLSFPVDGGQSMFSASSYKQHIEGFYYIIFSEGYTNVLGTAETILIQAP